MPLPTKTLPSRADEELVRLRVHMVDGRDLYYGRLKLRVPGEPTVLELTPRQAKALRADGRVVVEEADAPARDTEAAEGRAGGGASETRRTTRATASEAEAAPSEAPLESGAASGNAEAEDEEPGSGASGEMEMTAEAKRPGLFRRRRTETKR